MYEIDAKASLRPNADITHESAEEWYGAYGGHVSTSKYGDLDIQAVKYTWLDGADNDVAARLREKYPKLREGEVVELASTARAIREAADTVARLLGEAVAAYQASDLRATAAALEAASTYESQYGDDPATQALASQLISAADADADA